ncbi:MAG: cobyric acid synthase [Syntrophobacterales bacterium]|nr:cobyric acid synthase [Syntrophobacterales bacterium]
MPRAKSIMFLGTGSDVGKSLLAAALCRVLKQDGYRVAPFKAQNMALNSFVTAEGGEMGRAQVVQAEAAGVEPHVDMNPILLKPTSQVGSQVIVLGRPIGNMIARDYYRYKKNLTEVVKEAYERLAKAYDVIVMEGAGSAVELNLKEHDIVNLAMAKMVKAPCILIGDIDRGGIFASLIGSLYLMEPEERELIAGLMVNKFRGDIDLFKEGVEILERLSHKPVLGVVPHFNHIHIHEEDSVALTRKTLSREEDYQPEEVLIGVVRLPYISNYTDFDILERENGVRLKYFNSPEDVFSFDAIIIPGSKNTLSDLATLHESGMVDALKAFAKRGRTLVGICGGYQMLGKLVRDKEGLESNLREIEGLGLIPMVTEMFKDKITYQVEAFPNPNHPLWKNYPNLEQPLKGYEIHMGRSFPTKGDVEPLFNLRRIGTSYVSESQTDGLTGDVGKCWGTYIHGIFDNDIFRKWFIRNIAMERRKPLGRSQEIEFFKWKEHQYDLLAEHFRTHVNIELIYKIIGL